MSNFRPKRGDDAIDELLQRKALREARASRAGGAGSSSRSSSSSKPRAGVPSEQTLLGSMAARLAKCEDALREARREREETRRELVVSEEARRDAEARLAALENGEGAGSSIGGGDAAQLGELQAEMVLLRRQISEMESFLNEAGLVWVGHRHEDGKGDLVKGQRLEDVVVRDGQGWQYNHTKVLENLALLSSAAEKRAVAARDGGERRTGVAGLRDDGNLVVAHDLALYANGILFRAGPFRAYADEGNGARDFIQDVEDGYFPSELRELFPLGIKFRVRDAVDETYDAATKAASRVSKADFIQRLPKSVLRSGRVLDVRAGVQDLVAGERVEDVVVADTPLMQSMRLDGSMREDLRVTTLQIRAEDGKTRFILKLKYSDTLADVRAHLDAERAKRGLADAGAYELRTNFPRRAYHDNSETLEAAGLVPNAALVCHRTA